MFDKDEKYLRKNFGKATPFKAPVGYFDALNDRIMSEVKKPHENVASTVVMQPSGGKTISLWARYRKAVVGIAASVCVGIFTLGAYLHVSDTQHSKSETLASQAQTEQHTYYSSIDAMVDYTMMDTEDMYAYMADMK